MKPTTLKRVPTQAERMMKAAADDLAEHYFRQFAAEARARGAEFEVHASRKLGRLSIANVATVGDAGRAMGVICGSAVMLEPAFQGEARMSAAEALFRREEGE